jgi:hypothetical protein
MRHPGPDQLLVLAFVPIRFFLDEEILLLSWCAWSAFINFRLGMFSGRERQSTTMAA